MRFKSVLVHFWSFELYICTVAKVKRELRECTGWSVSGCSFFFSLNHAIEDADCSLLLPSYPYSIKKLQKGEVYEYIMKKMHVVHDISFYFPFNVAKRTFSNCAMNMVRLLVKLRLVCWQVSPRKQEERGRKLSY